MSQPVDLKAETKKSVISEIVKTAIRLGLLLISVLAVAVFRPLRERIWPAIPKWLLAALLVTSLSAILGLTAYITYLRRRARAMKAEVEDIEAAIQALKAKPQHSYKFGIKWDGELNPVCPHCNAYLSAYHYFHLSNGGGLSQFVCQGCGRTVSLADENAAPIRFEAAKERMQRALASNAPE